MDANKKLLEHLKGIDPEARQILATACETSVEYLFQIGYGNRKPKAALAVALERETAGAIKCEELMPEVDWAYLRTAAA